MTLQEEFEQQYEALNAYPVGFMVARRLADAYSEPRETRAYRWFVRGRSFGVSVDAAEDICEQIGEPMYDEFMAHLSISKQDWIAIGSLMRWIPEKEK